ncbi:unnamed protein product, partial [Ilex paraguariensis]
MLPYRTGFSSLLDRFISLPLSQFCGELELVGEFGLKEEEMASIAEGPLPFKVSEEQSSSSNPTDAVIFVGISLVLGIACRHVLRGTRVPYTVALLVLGIGMGSL